MQELNMLHVRRIELQDTLKKLQKCMNLLEEERAWQDIQDVMVLLQQHQAVVKVGVSPVVYQTVWQNVLPAMHICFCCCMLRKSLHESEIVPG